MLAEGVREVAARRGRARPRSAPVESCSSRSSSSSPSRGRCAWPTVCEPISTPRRRARGARPSGASRTRAARRHVVAELGDAERASVVRVARADEDGRRDAESFEDRGARLDAAVRVVERHVDDARRPSTTSAAVPGRSRAKERPMRLERVGRDGQPVRLGGRDGVVAEDQRSGRRRRRRPRPARRTARKRAVGLGARGASRRRLRARRGRIRAARSAGRLERSSVKPPGRLGRRPARAPAPAPVGWAPARALVPALDPRLEPVIRRSARAAGRPSAARARGAPARGRRRRRAAPVRLRLRLAGGPPARSRRSEDGEGEPEQEDAGAREHRRPDLRPDRIVGRDGVAEHAHGRVARALQRRQAASFSRSSVAAASPRECRAARRARAICVRSSAWNASSAATRSRRRRCQRSAWRASAIRRATSGRRSSRRRDGHRPRRAPRRRDPQSRRTALATAPLSTMRAAVSAAAVSSVSSSRPIPPSGESSRAGVTSSSRALRTARTRHT